MQIWKSYRINEKFNHTFSEFCGKVIKSECKEMTLQHLWEIRNLLVLRTAEKDYFTALTLAEKWFHIKNSWPWLWLIQYVLLPYTWFNLN